MRMQMDEGSTVPSPSAQDPPGEPGAQQTHLQEAASFDDSAPRAQHDLQERPLTAQTRDSNPPGKDAVDNESRSSGSGRPRNNSLRRRENDKGFNTTPKRAQRQRPTQSTTLDAFAPQGDRKTSNFKVGNVGIGGRIYLRPVMRPTPQQSAMPQSPTRTIQPQFGAQPHHDHPHARQHRPSSQAIADDDPDHFEGDDMPGPDMKLGKVTRTDFTGRESVWTKLSGHDVRGAPSDIFKYQPRSRRSMSESTADHNPANRPAALAQTKAFKVVIDRPDSDLSFQRKARHAAGTVGALDISIPNYRIGSPRFSSTGTPFMQSSVYAQSQHNLTPGHSPGPSPSIQQAPFMSPTLPNVPNRRHSHAALFPSSALPSSAHNEALAWRNHVQTETEGISPRIYDALAADPNSASVIKYSPTGEVIAATPARLIVQITAETFLDYELLSDFFLTVRCYLNTHDLLALLLARFEWAVNRDDDNGRIIRVRSFAAIRHWILNYFAYDFVPDRRLRVTFCRKLNAIFKVVQSRREMGASDTKLISDLKKCWNGRCVMYWERPVDNTLEADILPGGTDLHGKTNSEELEEYGLGSVTAASTDIYSVPESSSPDYETGADGDSAPANFHTRTASGTTSHSAPLSPTSDVSAPVMSCSIPAIMGKKVVQSARQMIGPVPAGQRPQTEGNRNGNRTSYGSSEAVREAQSLERQNAIQYSLQTPVYRSVLRGHLLPPASPYVTTPATASGLNIRPSNTTSDPERKKVVLSGSSSGPGMKNLIGNIKRALSSKTASADSYSEIMIMDSTGSPSRHGHKHEGHGRHGKLPIEVLNKEAAANFAFSSVRAVMRIDSLSEQIALEFQRVTSAQPAQVKMRNGGHGQTQLAGQMPGPTPGFLQTAAEIKKLPSGMTSSSQSIVIFDDTGVNAPSSRDGSSGTDRTPRESTQIQAAKKTVGHLAPNQEVNGARGIPSRLSLVGPSHVRNPSQASSLRRVASYQSALNRPIADDQRLTSGSNTPDLAADKNGQLGPARGLRRVPGGDLRANQNIADLETIPRPKSTGSINTFASTRESEMLSFGDRITKTFKRDRTDRPLISPGLTGSFDKALKGDDEKVSFIRTRSEDKPNRRPSFEAVVASFAEIPDEEEGGIEATLMKLEGRYRPGIASKETSPDNAGRKLERVASAGSAATVQQRASAGSQSARQSTEPALKTRGDIYTLASTDYARSEDSYNSIPLLERGADSMAPPAKGSVSRAEKGGRSRGSHSRDATKSFLLDEQEDEDEDDDDDMSDGTFDTMDTRGTETPDNAYLHASHPPSPPISDEAAAKKPDDPAQAGRRPPTPDPSPSRGFIQPQFTYYAPLTSQTHPAAPIPLAPGLQPRHIPFVLGHETEVLFQQLTLIEKDALREIDWRDLVHMRWQQQAEQIQNWVSYLSTRNPPGIDMVTSRFNVMVKWALSEIVLTESIEERALTIIKFIHIASTARRNGNFATLLQLTIALTSGDCSRLRGTWALVPQTDKSALAELEALVSPRGNFAALRSEMEDAPAETGCIPVLALYIHDLTYNSQKPSVVESPVAGAGLLVNFERYRSAAVIVKNLLRLIDASSKYNFTPVDDVLSHSMWMACLPDAVIMKKSKDLEVAERTGQEV